MPRKTSEMMTGCKRTATKMLGPALAFLLLSGCLATNPELAEQPIVGRPLGPIEQQPTDLVQPPVTAHTAAIDKEKKLLEEKNQLNKYVNQRAPSQLRYSLQKLNEGEPDDGVYPTIKDLSTNDDNLRSQAERKRLEDELEALNR